MIKVRSHILFFRKLWVAARYYRVGFLSALLRSLSLYVTAKFSLREIIGFGLFVPSIVREFPVLISKERSLAALNGFNPPQEQHLTEDKDEFYRFCHDHGLPVPKTIAWTKNGLPYNANGDPINDPIKWATHLEAVLPQHFVVKDRAGAYGSGFFAFQRVGENFRTLEIDGSHDINQFMSIISPPEAKADYLIQERLFDADQLASLSGRRGLQTMRVTTLLEEDGQVSTLFYMVKILAGQQDVDNFSMGTTGNLVGFGDRQNGVLRGAINIHPCGSGMTIVDRHPRTGIAFDGFQLPFWDEAIELVKRAQQQFPMLRTLGWDVALTAEGPKIIEANSRWDPPLYAPFIMAEQDWRRVFLGL